MDGLVRALRGARTVTVCTHVSPDGDAIGSALSMARALRILGKDARVVGHDPIPADYLFLPDTELWLSPPPDLPTQDVCLMVDVCDPARVGDAAKIWENAAVRACIDHHIALPQLDVLAHIDSSSPSCAQLVFRVIEALAAPIDEDMATLLFAGLSADTGHFMFDNAKPCAFADAARLAELGARVCEYARRAYQQRSLAKTRLLAACLASLDVRLDGKVAMLSLTQEDYRRCGAQSSDTEGLVNFGRDILGVDVSMLARISKDGGVRISLRSSNAVDVAEVCRAFGGGGHARAAGCTLTGVSIGEAQERVLHVLEKYF